MNLDETKQIVSVLSKISKEDWDAFFASEASEELNSRVSAAHAAAHQGRSKRPIAEVVALLGHRLLSDRHLNPWLRRKILEHLAPTKWDKLFARYRFEAGVSAAGVHGNMTQAGKGSAVMAAHWRRGGRWAYTFCEVAGLPFELAQRRARLPKRDEEIIPVDPLPQLHSFQEDVYRKLRKHFWASGQAAMLSLPTGAGKTRVAVEAICDHLAALPENRRLPNVAIWIAQSDELLLQAWECFRQVWQAPPEREPSRIRRITPLSLVRAWGGRQIDDIEVGVGPTVILASIQQLLSWSKKSETFAEVPRRRLSLIVVDEAHSITAKSYRDVFLWLRVREKKEWLMRPDAPAVLGLTATPWRSNSDETKSLKRFFNTGLFRPAALGEKPIQWLQNESFLSNAKPARLRIKETRPLTPKQQLVFDEFKELPSDYIEQLGLETDRNRRILDALVKLPKKAKTIVFACSIEHAEILTLALNSRLGDGTAALVTSETPRAERAETIERFRTSKSLRMICNVGVLTTGFDAPKTNVVCITRPTTSAVLYEQMVGRGLRGPRNGGTEKCLVLDVQDDGMPSEVQSYARVLEMWDHAIGQ